GGAQVKLTWHLDIDQLARDSCNLLQHQPWLKHVFNDVARIDEIDTLILKRQLRSVVRKQTQAMSGFVPMLAGIANINSGVGISYSAPGDFRQDSPCATTDFQNRRYFVVGFQQGLQVIDLFECAYT